MKAELNWYHTAGLAFLALFFVDGGQGLGPKNAQGAEPEYLKVLRQYGQDRGWIYIPGRRVVDLTAPPRALGNAILRLMEFNDFEFIQIECPWPARAGRTNSDCNQRPGESGQGAKENQED
jgi:hypothetical protein